MERSLAAFIGVDSRDSWATELSRLALKLGLLFPILLVVGCISGGPVRSLAVDAKNTTEVDRNLDGTVTLRSAQTHIVSVLPQGGRFNSDTFTLPAFHVIVTNGGKENVMLRPNDISAHAGDRRVALLNPDALQERLDREQAAAGNSTSYPIVRDATQSADVTHEHHSHHPSPTRPAVKPYASLDFKVPTRVVEQALQPQVIRPFEVGGGRIMLEAEEILSGLPLKIVVTVAGEKHEFLFEVQYYV
jgi:hypothetical protein